MLLSKSAMAAARSISRLAPSESVLFVCDLQDKFANNIQYFPQIVETTSRLVAAARILDMKTIATEQYPKGLGHLVKELGLDASVPVFEKTRFSMCIPEVNTATGPASSVILTGIEAHACVLQTALDLLEKGVGVHVVVDAVSSRSPTDRLFALRQMEQAGAVLTTSECVILGLCRDAKHPKFREVQKLIMTSAPDTGLAGPSKL